MTPRTTTEPSSVDQTASTWVREPRQARARQSLERALDAAASLLAEEGYAGFSIAAVCRRASVSTGSLYGRFSGKEELFLAVHERELARTLAQAQAVFRDDPSWQRLTTPDLVTRAVSELARHFADQGRLLRVFILRAALDERVLHQGNEAARVVACAFVELVSTRAADFPHPDPVRAVETAYELAADSLTWRIAFGAEFAGPVRTDRPAEFERWSEQVGAACRTLLLSPPR